jgi:hypothetical protein
MKKGLQFIFWGLLIGALVTILPAAVEACPRCFEGTPYRTGLIWAAVFLLPVPFVIVGVLAYWLTRTPDPKA